MGLEVVGEEDDREDREEESLGRVVRAVMNEAEGLLFSFSLSLSLLLSMLLSGEEEGRTTGSVVLVAGACARRGCWSTETRSSTSRADAIGAMPGRVTVHCWSRVASLRDCRFD